MNFNQFNLISRTLPGRGRLYEELTPVQYLRKEDYKITRLQDKMECLIGIKGKDFVLVASDNMAAHSIIAIKHDAQKQFELSDKMVMAVSGDAGDMTNYAEYIQKNLKLYEMVQGYKLSPNAAANFSRKFQRDAKNGSCDLSRTAFLVCFLECAAIPSCARPRKGRACMAAYAKFVLSNRTRQSYQHTIRYIRQRLSFCILKTTVASLRGSEMECLIGIKGKDFVLVASDNMAAHSIIAIKHDAQKQFELSDKMVMAVSGDAGDMTNYAEYIQKNLKLYEMVQGYKHSGLRRRLKSVVSDFTNSHQFILSLILLGYICYQVLAKALRSSPYMVNLLLAGVDENGEPSLYFMDYLASMAKENYAAHGYGSFFILSTMDRYYKEDMTKDEALELLKKCIKEVQSRFIVNLNAFSVKIIDANGITQHPEIPGRGTVHKDVPVEAIHPLIARA
eukprot:sb/3464642/